MELDGKVFSALNVYLSDGKNPLVRDLLRVVGKYGTPEEINERAREAGRLERLLERLENRNSPHLKDLEWLMRERDRGAFVSLSEYRARVLGTEASTARIDESSAVTLEISALQYFPWLVVQARRALEKGELLPGRFIRVRNMREQERDGDLPAVAAAMKIVGASWVETLDTKGTDGSNVHLGGPETITGYFGGIGQPNGHVLRWIDEYLHYYTNYGVSQVLNVNPGTVLAAYLLYRIGVDIKFKISVFMGNDNPYAVLWTLVGARLFARDDGSTPLEGFNVSNSVDDDCLAQIARLRRDLGLEDQVRIEHHITETYRAIVRQPYLRRDQLIAVARSVPNISAKHEGGDPDDEAAQTHSSSILDYFRTRSDVESSGDMEVLQANYLLKHVAVNRTAEALTRSGLSFVAASRLHGR
ncbi:hypothetical protein KAR29_13235 [Aminithiophilus ramosus]|uniref:Uncharacterized protein n=2 Tax=Synergistales TaxID=649776 RepID=A0A9Q7ABL5_9BACT|nr:hypothetical protein KAR29_13235 [Aminithiophilus ramosus]QVL37736.1 hypothetical protein KIH16_13435 [Synergistota bacterium]